MSDEQTISDLVEKARTEYHKARAELEQATADCEKARERAQKYRHVLDFLTDPVEAARPTPPESGE